MKTFNQFCTEAYEAKQLTEGPLQFMGKLTGITPLVKGAQQFAKTPGASSVALGKGLASMEVKSRAARALTKPVKAATGNNPVINQALDIGADYVAPFVPTPKAIKEPIVKAASQATKAVTTQGPKLARTFGKNLLVKGPQTALKFTQGLATLAGVGSRLN
jgi:hypothetical protein